jgi:hypothetical protein
MSESIPFDAASMACACVLSLRGSNTPTTAQPVRSFSGLALFVLNSKAVPRKKLMKFRKLQIIVGFPAKSQSALPWPQPH